MNLMRWTSRRLARLEAQAAARRPRADDQKEEKQRFWRLVLSDERAVQLARACIAIITQASERDPELKPCLEDEGQLLARLDDVSLRALRERRVELDERLAWVEANRSRRRTTRASAVNQP